jgi:glyoxylase-like metal-dependent hydrolase (beta-lactamase superfamily II)
MKLRNLATWGGITLGAAGAAFAIKSFLPQHFMSSAPWYEKNIQAPTIDTSTMPQIDVRFLRCGSVTIPECIAVRGAFSLAPRTIAYSAVLIHHPRATFLYDTGLCHDIHTYIADTPLLFRKTLGSFLQEQSLASHLYYTGIASNNPQFALLSHLHWDHVSGIPDLPGVPLRINRVEYDAAKLGLLDSNRGLVRRLMGPNPSELFDCTGPSYEGFRSSHDLFGDGSIMLVPLPGHTPGQVGMFINRSNGPRLFLLGDAAWVNENYLRPATMHPFIWSAVTADDATARQTLIELHQFACQHPEIPMIGMHDAGMQEQFMTIRSRMSSSPETELAPVRSAQR